MDDTSADRNELLAEVISLRARVAELEQQQKLARDRARFEMSRALSLMPAVVYTCGPGPDYPTTSISDSVEQLLGYSPDQFYNDPKFWEQRIHPDDLDSVLDPLLKIEETNECGYEYRFRHANGQYRWLDDKIAAYRDKSGNVVGLVGTWFDVTDRKRAEDNFTTSEERFHDLFDRVPVGLYRTARNGAILEVNSVLVRMLGFPDRQSLLNTDVRSLYIDELDRNQLLDFADRDGVVLDKEFRGRRLDGKEIWIKANTRTVRGEGGEILFYEGSLEDVTSRKEAELELRRERDRAQTYLDTAGSIMVAIDAQQRVILINKKGCEVLGLPEEQILGRNWFDHFLSEREREEVRKGFCLLMNGERDIMKYFENSIVTHEGEERIIAWHNAVLCDSDNNVTSTLSSGLDITERRQAEAALRQSEERAKQQLQELDTLYRTAPVGLCLMNTDLEFVRINEQLAQINGAPVEAHFGRTLRDIVPDLAPTIEPIHWNIIQTGEPVIGIEVHGVTPAHPGEQRQWLVSYAPVKTDTGTVLGINTVVSDITDLKQAQENLKRYQHMVAATSDYMAFVDSQYICQTVNDGYLRALHADREEIIGTHVRALLGQEVFETVSKPRLDRCLAGERVNFQAWYDFKGTGRIFMDVAYSPHRNDKGDVTGVTVSARDITERKRAEEAHKRLEAQLRQSQKLQAVGQLAAGVSHDFNSLLTVILGHVELMMSRRKPGGKENVEKDLLAIQQVLDAVERGRRVVNKLLTFGRTQKFRQQPVDLNQVIQGMDTLLHGLVGSSLTLTMKLEPDVPAISADAGQIEQVIMNLVINARDAMPKGGTLTVETATVSEAQLAARGTDRSGPHVLLAVHDTGKGMDRELKDRLFEPFFTTKPVDKGTGLGLSIVHGIVEQSGGVIDVETAPGSGSIFRLYFPQLP